MADDVFTVIGNFWKGLKVTLGHMTRERVTNMYPQDMRDKPARFHGRHVLNRYEDGMEKCIGCQLCAGVCPANCIFVRGEDNPPEDPVSPGERFGFVYEINMLRCVFCALCVEACPTEAITTTKLFEMSVTNREDAIFTKAELLVDRDGTPNHHNPNDSLADMGELEESAGWMRATSPQGKASYEGVPAWTGTVGHGVHKGEKGQSVASERDGDA